MRAATIRLEVSARDIATLGTKGTPAPVYLVVRTDQTQAAPLAVPQVSLAPVRNVSPTWMAMHDPDASSSGRTDADLSDAMLEQATAKYGFISNARTFEAAQEMVKQLFELVD